MPSPPIQHYPLSPLVFRAPFRILADVFLARPPHRGRRKHDSTYTPRRMLLPNLDFDHRRDHATNKPAGPLRVAPPLSQWNTSAIRSKGRRSVGCLVFDWVIIADLRPAAMIGCERGELPLRNPSPCPGTVTGVSRFGIW